MPPALARPMLAAVERLPGSIAEPEVVLLDRDFVVLAKPAGMHTAPLAAGEGGTLLDWVLARFPEVASVPGLKPVEPGLLHRLDVETSGLVLVARNTSAWKSLLAASRAGRFVKRYRALVRPAGRLLEGAAGPLAPGGLEESWAERLAELERGGSSLPVPLVIESAFRAWGPGRRRVAAIAPGGNALSRRRGASPRQYRTRLLACERTDRPTSEAGAVFRVLVEAERGFRHQVRVHLASIGLPILGDELYGSPEERLFLHACRLELPHPSSGLPVVVSHEAF